MSHLIDPRQRLTRRGKGTVGHRCGGPRCRKTIPLGERYCDNCKVWAYREDERRRGSYRARGYGPLHRGRREQLLGEQPLCVLCLAQGRRRGATVRDHIIALADGGEESAENTQPLCKWCHRRKSREERRARSIARRAGRAGGIGGSAISGGP